MSGVFVGPTFTGRFGKRSEGFVELAAEAADGVLKEATDSPDALVMGTEDPEGFCGIAQPALAVADALGLAGRLPALRIEAASASGAAAFHAAADLLRAGRARRVLVVACEKMTHVPTERATTLLAKVVAPQERAAGVTMAGIAGLATRAYQARWGLKRETLTRIAMKNHANGAKNPGAHFRKHVTWQEVEGSKLVADPLTLFDCAPFSDGAAAAILTADRTDVEVAGLGAGSDLHAVCERVDMTSLCATREAARFAFAEARSRPQDVGVAEVHDAFTLLEIVGLEDLGFCPPGGGGPMTDRGETEIEGRLPVNPSGGLKARGHPTGTSGLAGIVEIADQLRNRCGARQVARAELGAALSLGGFGCTAFVTLLWRL